MPNFEQEIWSCSKKKNEIRKQTKTEFVRPDNSLVGEYWGLKLKDYTVQS